MSDLEVLQALGRRATDAVVGRSLVTTQEWSVDDLNTIRAAARALAELDRAGVRTPLCPAELAWAVFFDKSTRTKSAWAGAAARLGMQPVIVDGSSTQVSHGETAVETGAMLGMNAHAMGIRHDLILGEGNTFIRDVKTGIDDYLAATADDRQVPIVNLQCDVDHPTQTMADLIWLEENLGDLADRHDHRELGLLAVVRQAAVGAAGPDHAAHPLRRARHPGSPAGLPAHRLDDGRRRAERIRGRLVPSDRRHGRGVRRRRRRVPEELGPLRPDARARRRQRRRRRRTS